MLPEPLLLAGEEAQKRAVFSANRPGRVDQVRADDPGRPLPALRTAGADPTKAVAIGFVHPAFDTRSRTNDSRAHDRAHASGCAKRPREDFAATPSRPLPSTVRTIRGPPSSPPASCPPPVSRSRSCDAGSPRGRYPQRRRCCRGTAGIHRGSRSQDHRYDGENYRLSTRRRHRLRRAYLSCMPVLGGTRPLDRQAPAVVVPPPTQFRDMRIGWTDTGISPRRPESPSPF